MSYNIEKFKTIPKELRELKQPVSELFYIGESSLLQKPLVSIVGTRKPRSYTRELTAKLSSKLSNVGVVVVSGGAIGVDTIAHKNSYPNTIAVMANSLDIYYPAINRKLFDDIYKNSLAISEYQEDFKARVYTFVHRNRIVTALGECLIVTEADKNSGSLRSVEFALEYGKKIYVLPHRSGESIGTQKLIESGQAEVIYDIDNFVSRFGNISKNSDEIITFCSNNSSLNDAISKYGNKIYEYELEGKITIKGLKVFVP